MASTYITKANPTAGNRTKGTISVWIKRSGLSSQQHVYSEWYDGSNFGIMRFNSNNTLGFFSYDGGSAQVDINTTRAFRDINAWYHIVVAWDTTDSTSTDRVKIYVNGVRETSFSGSPTYPSSSQNIYFGVGGSNYPIYIGRRGDSAEYFDGLMSHFHRVDNQALAQTVFGSTDATTGEWKINTNPSISYTGSSDFNFFILKDGNSVTDQSGQSNNLTVGGGTLSKTEDNPSNIFATLNTLAVFGGNNSPTIERGNTVLNTAGNNSYKGFFISTLGMTQGSGKFYCEVKANDASRLAVGVCNKNIFLSSNAPDSNTNQAAVSYYYSGNVYYDSNGDVSGGASYTDGDVLGIALDMENYRLFFHKNGTYMNSGDPTSSTGNVLSFTNAAQYVQNHGEMFFFISDLSGSGQAIGSVNFGNGYFGDSAISSAGTNASNNGIFEYDVPTGYTALSTKGLNL